MFSDNIIERHNALVQLMDLNSGSLFYIAVIALAIICWFIKEWI